MDIAKELREKGWKTVDIKTLSRGDEEHHKNVILEDFNFDEIAIYPFSLKKVAEKENTVELTGLWIELAPLVSYQDEIPSQTLDDSLVQITIDRVK
ncbi:hypothetical protein [Jeotgalibacillus soli]|uniref:Uncharacterized protein n=1 Tax=Jeotgalibacillus soli TaxID=889306 RepID=A0A0C2VMS7_9BACL|nr:hypothetical protein [Jeotgalibacillus soli]KIL45746.1 hypothetical protein KP78_20950 [Jeotgalibacillus soli]